MPNRVIKNCFQIQIAGNPVFKKRGRFYDKKKKNKPKKEIFKGGQKMPQNNKNERSIWFVHEQESKKMIKIQLSDLDFWKRNIQQFVDEDDDDESYEDEEE